MSNLKISSDLFLGSPELKRFQQFLSTDGYVRGLLNNSVTFGLIKSGLDVEFTNSKVSADSDINLNGSLMKTIKINPISGFDKFGNFLRKDSITNQIPIPDDDSWYWIKLSYEVTHEEKGLWNIEADGSVNGSGGELLNIARGNPNFPTRIRFLNAQYNVSDYDIQNVIDDNNFILNNVNFTAEENLKLAIVGTFTYGSPVSPSNKLIFNYDSCKIELVQENVNTQNSMPTQGYELGRTFYIARVRVDGQNIIIQDKRVDFWETKASFELGDISVLANPLIGIEKIKYDHPYTPKDLNIVEVAWAFRAISWSVNTETNVLTLSSGQGGKFKSINDFTNGDFDTWRVYTPDGKYSNIITSSKQGNAIDLKLDTLDIDSYSNDGGETFLQNVPVVVTPNAETIEVTFTPDTLDNLATQTFTFNFEINEQVGICRILAYKDVTQNGIDHLGGLYNVSYRYRNFITYSPYRVIPSDPIGFYNELAFDDDGNFIPNANNHRQPFVSDPIRGFVPIRISPNSFKNFTGKVDKGDIIGMQKITSLVGVTNISLIVGQTPNYVYISGELSLSDDVTINLDTSNFVDGNEFIIHFNATNVVLNSKVIRIVSGPSILKTLTQGDFYMMKNIENGLVINAKTDGQTWYLNQNYDLGTPGGIVTLTPVAGQSPITFFDVNGWGTVKGLFGYHIANGNDNTLNLQGKFIAGYDPANADFGYGTTGGASVVVLEEKHLAPHTHSYTDEGKKENTNGDTGSPYLYAGGDGRFRIENKTTGSKGDGVAHENKPPYITLLYAQKMF